MVGGIDTNKKISYYFLFDSYLNIQVLMKIADDTTLYYNREIYTIHIYKDEILNLLGVFSVNWTGIYWVKVLPSDGE